MANLTPGIGNALSGVLSGLMMRQEKDKADALLAKNKAGLAEQGFDESGNLDPGYINPENPSYQRAKQAAAFKKMGSSTGVLNPLTLEQVHSIRHPGVPLPAELQQYKDVPYDPKYDNLFTQGNLKPGDQLVGSDAERATEEKLGLPTGSLAGKLTANKAVGSATFTTGMGSRADLAQKAQEAADARLKERIGAAKDIAGASLAERERRARENSPNAKIYNAWVSGDRDAALGVIRDLKEARDQLRARGDSPWASYAPGLVPVFDKELEQIKTNIGNASSSGLKERFGNRPTNMDVQNSLRFSYNPSLVETQNAELLDKRIRTAEEKVAAKDKWASYFEKNNGRMSGFQGIGGPSGDGSSPTEEDLGVDNGAPTANPSDLRAKAAKTGGAAVNGNIIPGNKVAAIQAMPTKGTASNPKDGAVMKNPKDGKTYQRKGGRWFPVKEGTE